MNEIKGMPNRFQGVEVAPEALPGSLDGFSELLAKTVRQWKKDGLKVAWFKIPLSHAFLIPTLVEKGCAFHHSSSDYLMLTLMLANDAFVPLYATHYIGAGGVVINSQNELLVVCERFRGGRAPYYKLPGGSLQPEEHLAEGVVREVLEETGVSTCFDGLICFRHWHGYRYGKSDIYFVCRLKPLDADIKMQATEIEECFWMPLGSYMSSENVSEFNKLIVKAAVDHQGLKETWVDGYGDPEHYEFFMPE